MVIEPYLRRQALRRKAHCGRAATGRRLDFSPASDDPSPMSERAPPELSARALIARVAKVYMAPRWKGWLTALLAAIGVAYCSTQLIHLLKPATDELMVSHKVRDLIVLPLTLAAYAIGRTIAQVIQASLINRIGNA